MCYGPMRADTMDLRSVRRRRPDNELEQQEHDVSWHSRRVSARANLLCNTIRPNYSTSFNFELLLRLSALRSHFCCSADVVEYRRGEVAVQLSVLMW